VRNRTFSINLIGILAAVVMIAAMFYPWWSFHLQGAGYTEVYPYLLKGPGSELVGYKSSLPMKILTYVFYTCIGLSLVGSLARGRSGRLLLALSGVMAALGTWRLMHRLGGVAERFDIPLVGKGVASYEGIEFLSVETWLQPGFYLMSAAIVIVLLAALLNFRLRVT
jgi:hypothetical protein